jgi:hypothetical protein
MGKSIGGLTGGVAGNDFVDQHSDWPGTMMKLPQANGGVATKVTTHMPGNNAEGIVGGIDIKVPDRG